VRVKARIFFFAGIEEMEERDRVEDREKTQKQSRPLLSWGRL
jgi:hypothetical protein